ncbi:hypothetical protein GCM10011505_01540 [Tistrella bauzanensis]|uniref:Uncharacterized protein n=1 Tax=Tistrella bauzanensis TaxID=657419 RepID=A0ABQ1I7B5_9PROT|nr:hypothetical protein GCM10011505_01540 [Tistrella bauzanensis]
MTATSPATLRLRFMGGKDREDDGDSICGSDGGEDIGGRLRQKEAPQAAACKRRMRPDSVINL